MRIILFCIALVALLMVSCAPPKSYEFENRVNRPYKGEKDYDIAWQEIIRFFASNQIQIQTVEKASGIISSSMTAITPSQAKEWCDCGKLGLAVASNHKVSFNIFVEKYPDTDSMFITVNADFSATWNAGYSYESLAQCNSTGAFETVLLQTLK